MSSTGILAAADTPTVIRMIADDRTFPLQLNALNRDFRLPPGRS